MPYIEADRARALRSGEMPETEGELTYLVSFHAARYIAYHGLGFKTLVEVAGALDSTKFEVQRRIQAPYEDGKAADATRADPFRGLDLR